ncbi:MAG: hypothetical protein OXU20_35480, partial [Myxococcales bacterium]|nr:hypothetical protein [Myxococcales bacterium]
MSDNAFDTKLLLRFDAALSRYVRLASFPVAVRFIRDWDEVPERAKRPARDLGNRFTTCQAI